MICYRSCVVLHSLALRDNCHASEFDKHKTSCYEVLLDFLFYIYLYSILCEYIPDANLISNGYDYVYT